MQKIKKYFRELKSSFYNPAFYDGVARRDVSEGFGFLFVTYFLTMIAYMVLILCTMLPSVLQFSPTEFVNKYYPSDLEIVIKEGIASTNVEEPYIIPLPEDEKNGDLKNLIVLETKGDITLETIKSHNSVIVLTKDTVIYSESSGQIRMIPLKEIGDYTLNKSSAEDIVSKVVTWAYIVALPLILIASVFAALFSTLVYLILALLGALVAMVVGMIRSKKLTYTEAYVTALYAGGPIVVIGFIFDVFGIPLPFVAILVIFVGVIILNVRRLLSA